MSRLQCRRAEQDAVIRHNSDTLAMDTCEACHKRRPVLALELAEARTVDEPRNDVAHVEGLPDVCADDTVQFMCRIEGFVECIEL